MVSIRVTKPFRANVKMRERGTDFGTFAEVVLNRIYATVIDRGGPCEYVLDLGANIGLTSLHFSSAFPNCRILAVEPSPDNHAVLAQNLATLVAAGRCKICSGAVWFEDTTVDLNPPPNDTEYNAISVAAAGRGAMRQPVPAYTVASLMRMAGFPRVDILKMDVEGAEAEIFRGPTDWLARVNAIAIEFHGESRHASRFDVVAREAGFVVEEDFAPNTVVAFRPPTRRVR
ncbi:MAG: FkbM family methyltransferase [Gemmataceae bacterium]|nr:FkbM family methyltransferase [Gemmataceae bacterium]